MFRIKRFRRAALVALALPLLAWSQTAPDRGLILISIDGMHPENVLQADKYGLKIPTLRRFLRGGAHATSVQGVLPTVTYPTHTTMLTGVSPVKHGIYSNQTFDPLQKNQGGWYWYAEDIRVPTLWEAAAKAGYDVGSISWPVSIGAPGVKQLIPEFWRAATPDDLKLLRAISSPGIFDRLRKHAGEYILNLDEAVPGDWTRTRHAVAMIQHENVRFLTIHLGAFDHLEHAAGPFSKEAFEVLEETDKMVAALEAAIRSVMPNYAICIVSDHGFSRTDRVLNLNVAFAKAGLMKPNLNRRSLTAAGVLDWKAVPWMNGGSAAIVLRDPNDQETRAKVSELLRGLAADPANGIEKILDRKDIAALGGAPNVEFWVDMKAGFAVGSAMDGALVTTTKPRGTHGYSPTHPDLYASFLFAGPGVRKGANVGHIEMRNIAPTLAKFLGVSLPAAELPALDIFTEKAAAK